MKRAVIITSYLNYNINFGETLNSEDYVICTDGGYDIALEHGINVDLLLGDFDSIKNSLPKNVKIEKFKPEKDFTDLDLALKSAVESGYDEVIIIGGIGGRLDHTVANLQLLSHYNDYFDRLSMLDGKNKCFILDAGKCHELTLPQKADSYFSVFSLSEQCTGVTITGAKYNVTDHTFTRSFPLGVSNEFQEKSTAISIKDGTLLIVISAK